VTPERAQLVDDFLKHLAHLAVDEVLANPDVLVEIAAESDQEQRRRRGSNGADHTLLPAST
jgi:hypothetical protein